MCAVHRMFIMFKGLLCGGSFLQIIHIYQASDPRIGSQTEKQTGDRTYYSFLLMQIIIENKYQEEKLLEYHNDNNAIKIVNNNIYSDQSFCK